MVAIIKSRLATRSYVELYCALTTYLVFLCRISPLENYDFTISVIRVVIRVGVRVFFKIVDFLTFNVKNRIEIKYTISIIQ